MAGAGACFSKEKMKEINVSANTTSTWVKNAVPVSDVLLCMIKDARYHNLLVNYLVDVSEAWMSSMTRFSSEDPTGRSHRSYRILPELELLADILLFLCVNGKLQQRSPSTLGMEFVNLEVDASTASDGKFPWVVYSVLRCLVPYVIQRVGRWDDDVSSFRGSAEDGTTRPIESLRGEERRSIFVHQRKRVQTLRSNADPYLGQPTAPSTIYEHQQHRLSTSVHAKGIRSVYNVIKNNSLFLLQKLYHIYPSGRLLMGSLSIWSNGNDIVGNDVSSSVTGRPIATTPTHTQSSTPPIDNNNLSTRMMTISRILDIRTIDLIKYLFRLHLALFFLNSKYVSLLHRLTGILYRRKPKVPEEREVASNPVTNINYPSYKAIASLIVFESILELGDIVARVSVKGWDLLYHWLQVRYSHHLSRKTTVTKSQHRPVQRLLNDFAPGLSSNFQGSPQQVEETQHHINTGSLYHQQTTQPIVKISTGKQSTCGICFSTCETPAGAATQCGHVFCWACIINWTVKVRPECPLCRAKCSPQEVLALYNW